MTNRNSYLINLDLLNNLPASHPGGARRLYNSVQRCGHGATNEGLLAAYKKQKERVLNGGKILGGRSFGAKSILLAEDYLKEIKLIGTQEFRKLLESKVDVTSRKILGK